jgi:hypothetical protein
MGSGSILKVQNEALCEDDPLKINQKSIRFLSPREVANLHCFPNDFGTIILFCEFEFTRELFNVNFILL